MKLRHKWFLVCPAILIINYTILIYIFDGMNTNINNKNLHVFVMKAADKYPFKQFWSFDDYKINNTSKSFKPIRKLTTPQLLFTNFTYQNQTFPFFNPSIIRIGPNYKQFVSSMINSSVNRAIINSTTYIVLGRWNGHQCKQSYNKFNQSYSIHFQPNDYFRNHITYNGIHLLDKEFAILQQIPLRINYNKNIKLNRFRKRFLELFHFELQDCRLFQYRSLVFTYCITYHPQPMKGLIGALLWKEEIMNDHIQLIAYLDTNPETDTLFQCKQFYHKPYITPFIEATPKNLIPFEYDTKLYFQWELTHSYFIEIDLFSNRSDLDKYGIFKQIESFYVSHNKQMLYNTDRSYHQNVGFIHLRGTNELLGIGHVHYDLYKNENINYTQMEQRLPWESYIEMVQQLHYGIKFGHHYTHFFYTIENKPPFYVKRMSAEFCFNSPYIRFNTESDCDVIQFVSGMVENTINDREYLLISYGINDCISSILQIEKQVVLDMLLSVKYI